LQDHLDDSANHWRNGYPEFSAAQMPHVEPVLMPDVMLHPTNVPAVVIAAVVAEVPPPGLADWPVVVAFQ